MIVDATTVAWTDVCAIADLTEGRGVAAMVRGEPIAIFRLGSGDVYAISNVDPFSGASVLSRGITGDRAGAPKVASPMYKQSFDLRSGVCLDDPAVAVATYDVRVIEGRVQVSGCAGRVDQTDQVDQ